MALALVWLLNARIRIRLRHLEIPTVRMGLLLIVALVLAWPTYGLSLLAWFAINWVDAKNKVNKSDRRRVISSAIEPLFNNAHGDFARALKLPIWAGRNMSSEDATQCGRHIMNYIANNPEELSEFMKGLNKWRDREGGRLPSALAAVQYEDDDLKYEEVHLVSYRAVEALMAKNPHLTCFAAVQTKGVSLRIAAWTLHRAT